MELAIPDVTYAFYLFIQIFSFIHWFIWLSKLIWLSFPDSYPIIGLIRPHTLVSLVLKPLLQQNRNQAPTLAYFSSFEYSRETNSKSGRVSGNSMDHSRVAVGGSSTAEFYLRVCPLYGLSSHVTLVSSFVIEPSCGASIGVPVNSLQLARNCGIPKRLNM